ncbi:probable serine/threonine-protein kinase MARK-A [Daphnia pulex]|uniref:probable serine/threonine-protein kinase MARK-A n=1 Tax=Daphnia pulex TaxID=6669 RepID=UPI001EDFEF78|nr:probable serine/threonine-protein kinase MARK-A [Daphnia pulex]
MQKIIRRVIRLASLLVFLPSLLQAFSLSVSDEKRVADPERWKGYVFDDVSDSNYHFVSKQNLNLYKLRNKASATVSSGKNGYKYSKTKAPSYGQNNLNQYGNSKPNCTDEDEEFDQRKKIWKASLILGSVGLALSKLGLVSIVSPFLFVEDTTTSTSTTSTTSTSTSTSTSTTSTSTTSTSSTSTSTTSTTTTPTTTTSKNNDTNNNDNNSNNYNVDDNHNYCAYHVHHDDDSDSRRLQNHPKSRGTSGTVSCHHGTCWQQNSNYLHGRLYAGWHVHYVLHERRNNSHHRYGRCGNNVHVDGQHADY